MNEEAGFGDQMIDTKNQFPTQTKKAKKEFKSYSEIDIYQKIERQIFAILNQLLSTNESTDYQSGQIRKKIKHEISLQLDKSLNHRQAKCSIQQNFSIRETLNQNPYLKKTLLLLFGLIESICQHQSHQNLEFDQPEEIYRYFYHLKFSEQEMMKAIILKSNQFIQIKNLFLGGRNQLLISPREILIPVLKLEANQIILVHNHPSGIVVPSDQDFEFTRKIDYLSRKLGIKLVDHLIIGHGYYSFKQEGIL